jgi:hypothetical protein
MIHEHFCCKLQAPLVKRISCLANKDETHALSVLRFTLHEIRILK